MSESRKDKSDSNLAIVGFLGLTGALVWIFLANRGADIGNLPQLLGGLFRGNVFSLDGFAASLAGGLIAVLIVGAWFGLGKFVAEFFESDDESGWLDLARSCAFGAGIWSLVLFFAGLSNLYQSLTAVLFLIIGLALAAFYARRKFRSLKTKNAEKTTLDFWGKFAFGAIVFLLVLGLISALAPPTAKDALLYHAALPKQFVALGDNQIVEGNIASFLALGAEMHSVWAMLLGNLFSERIGEAAMGGVIFMFAPLLVLAIYGWARGFEIGKNWAMMAALLVAAVPTFYHVASSIYVDLALALFVLLAVQSLGKWWTTLQTKWLAFIALALGAALSIKLTTVFVIAAFALLILLRARRAQNAETDERENLNSIFLKGFGCLILAGLLAAPWYLRTWAKTGSPIFPFYMNVWKGAANGWDAERSALFQMMNSNYGGAEKGAFDYLFAPVKISLFAQPELPEFYDGVLGISFLLGLILIGWARQRKTDFPIELKIAVGTAGIVFLFWLFSSQQLRYLLPIVPGLAVATVVAANLISEKNQAFRKIIFAGLLATSFVGILTTVAWFAEKNPLPVVFGGESRDEYLTRRLDYYEYYRTINADLPADARIWLINMRRDSYHLNRAYFSDYLFEDWTLKKLVEESKDANDLRRRAKQMGITHVLTRHDFLLDYRRTAIVEEKRSEQENRAKLKIAEEFVLDKANQIRHDQKFSLVKLP